MRVDSVRQNRVNGILDDAVQMLSFLSGAPEA